MRDDFADLARRLLHESDYSTRAAARATHYDPAYLSRVLNGKQRASRGLAASLDELLGAGGALADALPDPDSDARTSHGVANPSRLDAGTVSALADVLAAYRRLDDTAPARSIIPATLVQARAVTRLLKGARGPHRDRLAAVASEFAQFGGWLLAQDRQDAHAVQLLDQAVELADEIHDGTLAAQALNFKGYLARQQGRPDGVARWYEAAACTPGAHPAQRLGDMLQAAAGMAELGRRDDALRMVENAERLTDAAAALAPPETAYWLTPEFNRLNMGIANLGLGRYADAADHITAGLEGLPPELRDAPWTREHRDALRRAEAAR
ncbi:helix-turn-helix domain-containing protein [Streptomyces sp. NPDC057702]|uniref:helix-turn-helix domain-containing protein n=1 Tax=unclassified Streptomyces TaxID=2593676 RepID=UPI00369E7B04